MRGLWPLLAMMILGACGEVQSSVASEAPQPEESSISTTIIVQSSPLESSTTAATTAEPTTSSVVDAAPTTLPPFVAPTPPADPGILIGTTMSTKQILTGPPPPPMETGFPPLLINGAATNLGSFGGACLDPICSRAVELMSDAEMLAAGSPATSSYLVLEEFLDRDEEGSAIWTVLDAEVVHHTPSGSPPQLLAEGCTLPGLPSHITPVAVLAEWQFEPVVPMAVWGPGPGQRRADRPAGRSNLDLRDDRRVLNPSAESVTPEVDRPAPPLV